MLWRMVASIQTPLMHACVQACWPISVQRSKRWASSYNDLLADPFEPVAQLVVHLGSGNSLVGLKPLFRITCRCSTCVSSNEMDKLPPQTSPASPMFIFFRLAAGDPILGSSPVAHVVSVGGGVAAASHQVRRPQQNL